MILSEIINFPKTNNNTTGQGRQKRFLKGEGQIVADGLFLVKDKHYFMQQNIALV